MNKVGDCLGYNGEACENCGRYRVEHYSKGFDICEKCRWCKQLCRYMSDDEVYEIDENYNWMHVDDDLIPDEQKDIIAQMNAEHYCRLYGIKDPDKKSEVLKAMRQACDEIEMEDNN